MVDTLRFAPNTKKVTGVPNKTAVEDVQGESQSRQQVPVATSLDLYSFVRDSEGEGGSQNQRRAPYEPYETSFVTRVFDCFSRGTGFGARPNLLVVFDNVFVVRAGRRAEAASPSPTSGYSAAVQDRRRRSLEGFRRGLAKYRLSGRFL